MGKDSEVIKAEEDSLQSRRAAARARSLANLRPFGPGNPPPKSPGRPRTRPITDSYLKIVELALSDAKLKALIQAIPSIAEFENASEAIAFGLLVRAVRGDPLAAKELREAIEGKTPSFAELQPEAESRQKVIEFSVTIGGSDGSRKSST